MTDTRTVTRLHWRDWNDVPHPDGMTILDPDGFRGGKPEVVSWDEFERARMECTLVDRRDRDGWAARPLSPATPEEPRAEPDPLRVFAVVFSNYYPRETDGIYQRREDAEARAAELGGAWEVEEWEVRAALDHSKDEEKRSDPLRAKSLTMAEYSDTRDDCPKCGEWRDSPTADCAGCGYAGGPSNDE